MSSSSALSLRSVLFFFALWSLGFAALLCSADPPCVSDLPQFNKPFNASTSNLVGSDRFTFGTDATVYGVRIKISTAGLGTCDTVHFALAVYSAQNFNPSTPNGYTLVATTGDVVIYSTQAPSGDGVLVDIPFTQPVNVTNLANNQTSYHVVGGFSSSAIILFSNSPNPNLNAQEEAYNYAATLTLPTAFTTTGSSFALGVDLITCNFTATPLTPKPSSCGSVVGDPQFVGLLGQSYQVHGIDGAVYNLISDRDVHVNSRFVFLTGGECLRDAAGKPLYTCWSHSGSYLESVALQTAEGDRLLVLSGPQRVASPT